MRTSMPSRASCFHSTPGSIGDSTLPNRMVAGRCTGRRKLFAKLLIYARSVIAMGVFVIPTRTLAQTDEIQVYDGEIAEQGIFNLMIHTNFTPVGRTTQAFPGAIIANDSVNGAAEWAYGV